MDRKSWDPFSKPLNRKLTNPWAVEMTQGVKVLATKAKV